MESIKNDLVDFSKKQTTENMEEFYLHCHGFYEIYYFVSGHVDYMVEGAHYSPRPGTLIFFRPGMIHGVKVHGDREYIRYAFHFMPDILPPEHREVLFSPFYEENVYYEREGLGPCFDYVLGAASLPKKVREIAVGSRFEALLTELYAIRARSGESAAPTDLAGSITAYINEHITEEISLDDLARLFFISKSQLNRIFRKSMDTTVGNYISLKRINLARQLLHSGETAEAAAAAAGFRDYSTFYRTYKRILGHSPAQTLNFHILEE